MTNSFARPDFSFPKQVEKNALPELEKALQEKDAVQATLAATQLVIASGEISADSLPAQLRLLDASIEKGDTLTASMLRMLKARLLYEVYTSDSYTYRKRQQPLSPLPESPTLWSQDQFAQQIRLLVEKALQPRSLLLDTPAKDVKALFTPLNSLSRPCYPNAYALLAPIGSDIVAEFRSGQRAIPFRNAGGGLSQGQQCGLAADEIARENWTLAQASGDKAWSIPAHIHRLQSTQDSPSAEQWFAWYSESKTSPYSAEYLLNADTGNLTPKERTTLLTLANEALTLHPGYARNPALRNLLASDTKRAVIKAESQVRSSTPFKITVEKTKGSPTLFLHIFKLANRQDAYEELKYGKALPTASYPVEADTAVIDCAPLAPGYYAALLSRSSNASKLPSSSTNNYCTFQASDLQAYLIKGADAPSRLYIVDAADGKPLPGVSVSMKWECYNRPAKKALLKADKNGCVEIPTQPDSYRNLQWVASLGKDTLTQTVYLYSEGKNKPHANVEIFTSLALYKPGQECDFALVAYETGPGVRTILPGKTLRLRLRNASWQEVDTLSLTTDAQGRAHGSFMIPKEGMLGTYHIEADLTDRSGSGSVALQVEEYRQPGFFITLEADRKYYSVGQEITLKGTVTSFAGIPMQDAEVKVDLDFHSPWWTRKAAVSGTYGETVITDSNGRFSLVLPTDSLAGTPFANGFLTAKATATATSGESQQSQSVSFSLGNTVHIESNIPDKIDATDSSDYPLNVSTQGSPEPLPVTLKVTSSKGETLYSQTALPSELKLPLPQLPSGEYTLTLSAEGAENQTAKTIIWRESDKVPPVDTPLWVPRENLQATLGQKEVSVALGSSCEKQTILCIASGNEGIIWTKYLTLGKEMVSLQLPAPAKLSATRLKLLTVRDAKIYTSNITLLPAESKLEMETISFRDHISAPGQETWKFRYIGKDVSAATIPVLATMTDKALNSIVPFRWNWNPASMLPRPLTVATDGSHSLSAYFPLETYPHSSFPSLETPQTYTYKHSLYPLVYTRVYAMAPRMGSAAQADGCDNGMAMKQSAMAELALEEKVEDTAVSNKQETSEQEPGLRMAEMPLAWFEPMLTTDKSRELELSFRVPDFNTTWQLQLLAYTPSLEVSNSLLYSVASRPLMIKSAPARFLRTGDEATLSATVFNNSGETLDCTAILAVISPLTQEVIKEVKIPIENLAPQESRAINIPWSVGIDYEAVAFRAEVKSDGFSDGEQTLIAILPSSTPVTESTPFYLPPAEKEFALTLPKYGKEDAVYLTYCDNPIWTCLTALPDMVFDTDASTLSLADQFYGSATAAGLCRQYPAIGEALRLWKESADPTLLSPLEKNKELKAIALDCTPWVTNAETETLRMQRLYLLTDSCSDSRLKETLVTLTSRQNNDGGWAWCPGFESSAFVTGQILWRLGMLQQMGYLAALPETQPAVSSAIAYIVAEHSRRLSKYGNSAFSLSELTNWFYIRSFFPAIPLTSSEASLKRYALSSLKKEWRKLSIYDQATAVTLLQREQKAPLCSEILASLQERASQTAQKGMWFDNVAIGQTSQNALIITAQVLEAFIEAEPESPCVDGLRQWLLLQRQTQDWGTRAGLAEIVWSILSSGTTWTTPPAPASFTLGGKPLEIETRALLTGEFTLPLRPTQASGKKLLISRSGSGPAWGGVVSRSIKPILDVKDFSSGEVKISKRLLKVEQTPAGTNVEEVSYPLHVGDKVRVQLTVESDRALDYVVITDGQSGCLAPADQVSGRKYTSESSYYQEIRRGTTNFFLPHVPKGRFLIEYDCHVEADGQYTLGIATLQSLYAPSLTAHSSGQEVRVAKN